MKALGIVFSNLHDNNISELTSGRTLASVPFGGRYRLVDFVLSSMVNSGADKVGIITKSNYQSLMDHTGSGKHWDLARKSGGLIILPPYGVSESGTLYENRLEALQNVVSFFKRSFEEYVVMSDCDRVCNINYGEILKFHESKNADITLVYTESGIETATRNAVLEMNASGRVNKFSVTYGKTSGKKPVYANICILKRAFLLRLLDDAAANGYKSFSKDILSKHTDKLRIFGYKFDGYFAAIDSMAAYYKHNLDILDKAKRDSLFLPDSPIYTKVRDSAPTRYIGGAAVTNSFIADGCVIEGAVTNSVLFRGVKVSRGASVNNSVLMQDTHISPDVSLNAVITDKNVVIRDKRVLSGCGALPYYIGKSSII